LIKTIEKRIFRLRKSLSEKNIDTFMVLIEENRKYLSAFTGEDTQFDESAGALFVTQDKLLLATDSRFELQAKQEAPLYDVYCYREGLYDALPDILGMLGSKILGFESTRLSYLGYTKIRDALKTSGLPIDSVGTEQIVESLRVCKEAVEVEGIRKSLSIAENVFEHFLTVISPGMTEKQAAWQMEKGMREAGAEALSFPVIAASGPNSALPHAIPGDRRFQEEEPILFDWGAILDGYCSDISRTVIIGRLDDTFKTVYTVVRDAQQKAIDAIRPGLSGKQVDDVARKYIYDMGYEGKFGHGLGHGVGLAVHEPPRLSPLKDEILEPGMVFTVEPGIYIPEWGGVRIENMVVVGEDGAEVLNRLDTNLRVIEVE
jgi:Xaa-Pro aminopeptidase